jgi:hypothetical protein
MMNLIQRFALLMRLRQCPHWNASVTMPGDRIQVCFDCGSTRRPDEALWQQPLYWSESEDEEWKRSTAPIM